MIKACSTCLPVLLVLAAASPVGAHPSDAHQAASARNVEPSLQAPAAVVDAFHAALARGDTERAAAQLADNALIFEGGICRSPSRRGREIRASGPTFNHVQVGSREWGRGVDCHRRSHDRHLQRPRNRQPLDRDHGSSQRRKRLEDRPHPLVFREGEVNSLKPWIVE